MQSPAHIKTSLASAIALRFVSGRFFRDARPYCINLLLSYPEDCKASCAYCGLARTRPTGEDSFIRVDWPVLETRETIQRIARYRDNIRRVCISTVFHPSAVEDTVSIAREIINSANAPLSVLITPGIFGRGEMERLRALGVDTLGIGLDAASKRVFHRTRAGGVDGPLSWEVYLAALNEASEIFGPGKVSCHIIVGIGETDRELSNIFFHIKSLKAMIHLFSFYPEPHSLMARSRRPSLKRFRRIQFLSYLVEKDIITPKALEFGDKGNLKQIRSLSVTEAINGGRPFLTGGCPGSEGDIACNRPFGSYRPGEPFRDFPFLPTEQDIRRIKKVLRLEEILAPVVEII
ncbi:MAG TPA: radical SAM protein [Candidatus Tripitaka californicus]|nr:radical SAM protein [Planctomycetota bacterium]